MMDTLILSRIQFGGEHHLPHSLSDDHDRARLGAALLQASLQPHRQHGLDGCLQVLGEGLRPDLRARRRLGRDHVLPVRHQLAGIHGERRQCGRAAARLRDPDRVFPGGDLPRGDAVRIQPGLEPHSTPLATVLVAFGTTMSAFWILVLNSWMHTPQGFEDARRRGVRDRLVGGDLSTPPCPIA